MHYKIIQIEGIGSKFASILQETAGIKTQAQLLQSCCQRRDRQRLAEKTGISTRLLLKWTNQADLSRIRGIAEEFSDLLERSGVDSVPELAQRNPGHLLERMRETNHRLKLVRHMPGLSQIESWIEQARHLPKAVYH